MKNESGSATLTTPAARRNGANGCGDLDLKKLVNALTAFKRGNFSARLPDDWTGVAGKVADTFNEVISTNERLAQELERISQTVGKKGRIHQRASLGDVTGSWDGAIGSVNALINDLGSPTSEMARVIGAVAKGDLSQAMATEVEGRPLEGEFLRTAKTVNTMVDQLGGFASEVTRVAREVGTEGKLGGQAQVKGVAGTWKDLTDSVNLMASNLTGQVRNIAEVTTAVANGDLAKKITVDVKGEFLELKDTINTMVDQLRSFASEVTRVAREVGTEGSLGGQARVDGVSGTWKDLTDNVNFMAGNLTGQVRNIAAVTTAVANGDLSRKITVDVKGEMLELKNTINTMVDKLGAFASEVTRVAKEVGTEGKLGGQARVEGVGGTWKDLTDNVNQLAGNLTVQLRDVSAVATAIADGDLTRKITVEAGGEILQIKNVINSMVDRLSIFAGEVTRVAREVGTEGVLGGQAEVPGVAGTWKGLTDNVNFMAGNLTGQVRNIADVTTAVAKGDLSRKITVDVKGEMLELKNTINTMVDQLGGFASEVTRVAKEVGTEGKLGGQAKVEGVGGTWKDLTDNVNQLAGNLTVQLRDVSKVATAIANGDLTRKITVEAGGEILQIKDVINSMVDRLSVFADEVTRVAREVGTEGVLGGQAEVGGVAGTWKDLTDNVNFMAGNLTGQVRNIAAVTTAVANGDLRRKITVDVKGEMLELKNTINTMVDKLGAFASEVTRVAKEVGTEGKLGGQARVEGVGGTWKDLTDNVNQLAGNLTVQLRDVSAVTTAIADGDLTRKITVEAGGEILQIKNVINSMVDRLSVFAGEVTRVAREVGTEGVLGGQAEVPGVAGTWKGLTDNVNFMAGNLTGQVRNIADVTTAVAKGDLSRKITVDVKGEMLELKNTINTMVDQLGGFASEVTRVAKEVGTEGKLGGQARVEGVGGTWKDLTDNVNQLAGNLTVQLRDVSKVATAIANGDLTRKITVEAGGEILQIKDVINSMVDRLSVFGDEVTRVAREVGTEGVLGGQAAVGGVAGTWKRLTDNVNFMAGNLTGQVRNIALVTTAVANGDLSQKITVDVKGEMLQLKDTINTMVDKLGIFADEVTRVAKEVGTEGKLGGQAEVPGAAGTWRGLTDNVNAMANSLTAQVRAIADVATAVTKGDLTRTIMVDAKGELDELKGNVNQMIGNLKDTTEKNTEQDWLKTNLAKFSRMMQGQKDLESVSKQIMSELTPLMSANHGAFYIASQEGSEQVFKLVASYAYKVRKGVNNRFHLGEGIVGQAALEKKPILLTGVPEDYIQIASGLGEAPPRNIIVMPTLFEGKVKAVIELASFDRFSSTHEAFLDQLGESIGIVLNTIEASTLTEDLLKQSQSLAAELQSRQQELTTTNQELEVKAHELADQNAEVERKNREVEQARQALEGKAQQLALTSKYKSEFLANMSHELRTPLNSLLILADQLGTNDEGNLTPKQVQFARTIHGSGRDLLTLINDILDLSKIESGTVTVDLADVPFEEVRASMERTFRPIAEQKQILFQVDLEPGLPPSLRTDSQRLDQILKNLLSNAFKFTERGSVRVSLAPATSGWSSDNAALNRAASVVAFRVTDSGIGISPEKHSAIFEAFQQADGSTSRRFGGTGLGLAISRELARLLGGEIHLDSAEGKGSVFTLFLPRVLSTSEPNTAPFARISPSPAAPPIPSFAPAVPEIAPAPAPAAEELPADDRAKVRPGDKTVMIIEDDRDFADWMVQVAHEKGFKAIVTGRGYRALALVNEFKPTAIILDVKLPDLNGWKVLERLKADLATRHIPVFVISGDTEPENALKHGALRFLTKPINQADLESIFTRAKEINEAGARNLLVVEDDESQRQTIEQLIGNETAHVASVGTGAQAVEAMDSGEYDCVVVDLLLPDMSGFDLIEKLRSRHAQLPIIVYTGKDLSGAEEARLSRVAQTVIVKDVRSPERLYDQTALWLHRDVSQLPDEKKALLQRLHSPDAILAGKKVLIVDDDVRNIFAMTSLLERYKMDVTTAETGKAAIEALQEHPEIETVLMDIMLPEMDGYETMRTIRGMFGFERLPIIALTAKAMKGDREKCIDAGASDYISKPVDTERLLTLLRTWLYR